jgi:hypothetical protein
MALKIGSSDVSFRLGDATPSAVYLGAQEVWSAVVPEPATLYFNGAVDSAWTTVGNWWLDDEHTEPAGRLPNSVDSVVATENITASGQTVVNFTQNDPFEFGSGLSGTLTVTGMATFFSGNANNSGTITGDATFSASSENYGTVNGDATFNDFGLNVIGSTVNGDATFNDSSGNSGTVTGNATFNNDSANFGTVTGNATFNDSSFNSGTVNGTITDNT